MRLSDFDYSLPEELIAKFPANPRDSSRLMVVDRESGAISHHVFRELGSFLRAPDLLVLNDTRVFPARLFGDLPDGKKIELLLLDKLSDDSLQWRCLVKPGKKVKDGLQ